MTFRQRIQISTNQNPEFKSMPLWDLENSAIFMNNFVLVFLVIHVMQVSSKLTSCNFKSYDVASFYKDPITAAFATIIQDKIVMLTPSPFYKDSGDMAVVAIISNRAVLVIATISQNQMAVGYREFTDKQDSESK